MYEPISIEEYKKLPSLKDAAPLELAEEIKRVLYDKRGRNIKILHVEDRTVIADYFVLCTGTSSTQVKAFGGEVEYKLGLRGRHPLGVEGRENSSWVLLDYGSVIVHIFSREARDFYNLDKLYGEIPVSEVADESAFDEDDEFEEYDDGDIEDIVDIEMTDEADEE